VAGSLAVDGGLGVVACLLLGWLLYRFPGAGMGPEACGAQALHPVAQRD
jgi:hypothetical protein